MSKIFFFFKKIIKYFKSNDIKVNINNGKIKENRKSINLNLNKSQNIHEN
tara:strand:- start:796 stop:945 length:150 start_codon:yes stop_codon:yes gene_type:complete